MKTSTITYGTIQAPGNIHILEFALELQALILDISKRGANRPFIAHVVGISFLF